VSAGVVMVYSASAIVAADRFHDPYFFLKKQLFWAVLGAAALWVGGAIAPTSVTALVVPMFVVMIAVGIAIPACQFAVMQPYTQIAGTASGLFFFIQMAITAACGGVLAWLSDGTAHPMIVVTAGASVAFVAVVVGFRERRAAGDARFAAPGHPAAER